MKALLLMLVAAAPIWAQDVLRSSTATTVWGYYSADAKPVLNLKSGETVRFETITSTPEVLLALGAPEDETMRDLKAIHAQPRDRAPAMLGPVAIEGAESGDVLQVDMLEIRPRSSYGVNQFLPQLGLLPDEFPHARHKLIRIDASGTAAEFGPGIRIPLRPFFGSMGVAPASGRVDMIPPGYFAGNLDNKELVAGSTLYIPVQKAGALFSISDGHLAMGDGEVDVSAIEAPLTGLLRFTVRKDMKLHWPRAKTPTHIITMGFHETLDEAARRATREMIDYVVTTRGLSRDDAYMLVSVAADLHITQMVDGVKGVHAMLPKAIFTSKDTQAISR
jgi:acetamidase/formamidase